LLRVLYDFRYTSVFVDSLPLQLLHEHLAYVNSYVNYFYLWCTTSDP